MPRLLSVGRSFIPFLFVFAGRELKNTRQIRWRKPLGVHQSPFCEAGVPYDQNIHYCRADTHALTVSCRQVKRARLQALEYKRQYGSPMPSRLLALAMADAAQVSETGLSCIKGSVFILPRHWCVLTCLGGSDAHLTQAMATFFDRYSLQQSGRSAGEHSARGSTADGLCLLDYQVPALLRHHMALNLVSVTENDFDRSCSQDNPPVLIRPRRHPFKTAHPFTSSTGVWPCSRPAPLEQWRPEPLIVRNLRLLYVAAWMIRPDPLCFG